MNKLKKFLSCISVPFVLLAACATGPIYQGPPPSFTPKAIMAGKACQTLPRNNFGMVDMGAFSKTPPVGMAKMDCGSPSFYSAMPGSTLKWSTVLSPGTNLYGLHGVVDVLQGSVDVCIEVDGKCKVESFKVVDKPVRAVIVAPQMDPLKPNGPMIIKVVSTSDKTIVGQVGTAESIS